MTVGSHAVFIDLIKSIDISQDIAATLSSSDLFKIDYETTKDELITEIKTKILVFQEGFRFSITCPIDGDSFDKICQLLSLNDLKWVALTVMSAEIQNIKSTSIIDSKITRIFDMLSKITRPKLPLKSDRCFFQADKVGQLRQIIKPKAFKRLFSSVWLEFVKLQLPGEVLQKCLQIISDKIMPHSTDPLLFADFFFRSYELGSPFNILALNGLFLLIVKHNLDYPDFLKNVYRLLTPDIFTLENRDQFFKLIDMFMSSLHIPAYFVAAFVKKLARLALIAPPDVILVVETLIKNWLVRHANVNVLMNRPPIESLSQDPFDDKEIDPNLSNAIDSSLWELKSLQSHYLINVVRKSTFINRPLEAMEDPLVQKSIDTLIEQHMRKSIGNEVPVAFVPPKSLFFDSPMFEDCFVE